MKFSDKSNKPYYCPLTPFMSFKTPLKTSQDPKRPPDVLIIPVVMMKGYLLCTNQSATNKTRMLPWSLNWFLKQFQTKLEQKFRMNFGGLKYGNMAAEERLCRSIGAWGIGFDPEFISAPFPSSSSSLQICRLRGWRGGCFRSHQYVPRHSRITNLLSSWELPNTAGNSPNVSNGEIFQFV